MRTSVKATIRLVSLISPVLDGTQLTFTVNSTCSFMLWFPPPPPCLPPLFAMIRLDLLQLNRTIWCCFIAGGAGYAGGGGAGVGFCVATILSFWCCHPKRNGGRANSRSNNGLLLVQIFWLKSLSHFLPFSFLPRS